jgi:hypothetical protein
VRCQAGRHPSEHLRGARNGSSGGREHHGLRRFGFDSENLEADIKRLEGLGARLLEGRSRSRAAPHLLHQAPDDVRLELIQRTKATIAGGCC